VLERVLNLRLFASTILDELIYYTMVAIIGKKETTYKEVNAIDI
jgi:hypothetical protein